MDGCPGMGATHQWHSLGHCIGVHCTLHWCTVYTALVYIVRKKIHSMHSQVLHVMQSTMQQDVCWRRARAPALMAKYRPLSAALGNLQAAAAEQAQPPQQEQHLFQLPHLAQSHPFSDEDKLPRPSSPAPAAQSQVAASGQNSKSRRGNQGGSSKGGGKGAKREGTSDGGKSKNSSS